jgi:FolB domain-containing protein
MDKVIIKDLLARGIIGIHDWERQQPQHILVNIVIFTDLSLAGESDDISDCIDYERLSNQVLSHVKTVQRKTVEALAKDIAQICLKEPKAQRVKVKVEKPGAISEARSVGVEIERSK